jgi:hypothetical protein
MSNIWINRRQPLRIEKILELHPDTFVPNDLLIKKGSREVKMSSTSLYDIREVNGMNPAVELAYCVKQELEGTFMGGKPKTLLRRKDLVRIAALFEAIRRNLPWERLLDA